MSLIRETLVPGIVLIFGVVYYLSIRGLPQESTVFPFFLMGLMPILVVLIMAQEYRKSIADQAETVEPEKAPARKTPTGARVGFKAPAIVFGGSIGYLIVFSLLGFLVASFAYVFFIMVYFGNKPIKSAVTSALFAAALYIVFRHMFFVDL